MATEQPISITYTVDNSTKTETFDFLIVACDPRWLRDALQDRTEFEDHVIDSLKSFTFRTSLFKAKRPDRPQAPIDDPDGARTNTPNYAVRFNPGVVEHQDGRPYGFRDEVVRFSQFILSFSFGLCTVSICNNDCCYQLA